MAESSETKRNREPKAPQDRIEESPAFRQGGLNPGKSHWGNFCHEAAMNAALDLCAGRKRFQVIARLQSQPGGSVSTKVAGKPLCRIGCYGTPLFDDLVYPRSGYAQFLRQRMHGHLERNKELFA